LCRIGTTYFGSVLDGSLILNGADKNFGGSFLGTSRSTSSSRGSVAFFACGAAEVGAYDTNPAPYSGKLLLAGVTIMPANLCLVQLALWQVLP